MIKNFSKIFALILTLIFSANYYAQCTGCTVTNPVLSGNYTFASGSTVCFTSNATLGDVTFQNNSKICVAPGVTVIIQNNVTSSSGNNVTLEIGGTLQFNNPPTFNANLTANVQSGGILRSGTTGNNNFTFNGTTNTLNNQGTVQVGVLQFQNSSSTNVVDNYGTLTIASNINIQGVTTFRNWNLINIGSSYNNNATSKYINCGTINSSSGFNLGGGKVINTGNFNIGSGSVDLSGGTLENYGTLLSTGSINGTGASIFYNEGLAKITSFQPNGASIKGPLSNNKKGYFYVINQINHNGSKVGPNLDFKKYTSFSPDTVSGSQGELQIFSNTPTYVNSSGTTTTASLANVTYACSVCTAPLVTNIGVCPNIDGTFPPQANDDAYTIAPGSSATSNVLANDLAQFNGAAATTSNVTITQVSTTNSGVTLNTSGIVSVAAGTPAGTYTIVYRICSISNPSSCDTATITVTVPLDSDGDGVPDYQDLDSDNDGILDIFECPQSVVDVNFSVANGNSQTFSAPAADLGFIFDVYTLDNSFTLTVNGASISSSKLEFQPNQTDNVRFVDGSTYGNGTVPQIYTMTGTAANPLVRIIIHKNGAISMYGSKTSGGPLFPLQLYNGNNFNTIIWNQTSANTVVVSQVVVGTTYISGRGNGVRNGFCDPDNDGISNQFDVDSDNDGCADAIEGSENVKYNQIHDLNLPLADPNYAYRGQIKVTYNGTTTSTPSGIISNSPSANGVPQLLNNAGNNLNASTNPSDLDGAVDNTDGTADIGQGIGDSQDNTINSCKCYKAPSTDSNTYPTQHGITAFNRAGADNQNWPMVRKSGWTALEASTKGFVINRMPVSTSGANTGEPVDESNNAVITSPIAGMMFYDTTNDCLKINVDGTRSGWKCFNNQSCPDEN